MKVFLLYRNMDFNPQNQPVLHTDFLMQDLEFKTVLDAMSQGDMFLYDIAKKVIFADVQTDSDTIKYRQDILKDCIQNPLIVRRLYQLPFELGEMRKQGWYGLFNKYPRGVLSGSIDLLNMQVEILKKLRSIAGNHADEFESEGFKRFFSMIFQELEDDYFKVIEDCLRELKFPEGIYISAKPGKGNEGVDYTLRKPHKKNKNWIRRIFGKREPSYSFSLHPKDQAGGRILSELKDIAINHSANALAQSADHIDNFFKMLRLEMAFYIGALNLYEEAVNPGISLSFPVPENWGNRSLSFSELLDISLVLTLKQGVTGNRVNADFKDLIIITGANQGGKSTFLRSIGQAFLMMQAGIFVAAESFHAGICENLLSHFRREEDPSMGSGKFDEELGRMSDIADNISSDSILLMNESFAATNEREGSEIAGQIIRALVEKGVRIIFVTHLYEFAGRFYSETQNNYLFLRAERGVDGRRTFRIIEGEPLPTSYGEDIYNSIFGD